MAEGRDNLGIIPYDYEPEFTQEELQNIRETSPITNLATLEDWCSCNACEEMPSPEECICCCSSEYVQPNIDDLECITEHPQFQLIVLNSDVLTVAFIQIFMFQGNAGRVPDNLTNQQSRLTAYRQFVYWMLRREKLGKGKRVVIPSCVVKCIREAFPESNGHYTGFRTVFDNSSHLF
ncbi:P2X purinoceptor 7-like [Mytilus trossulus]|uniref:P2X purinoceptor 7-like n=1 Tax=Mytilus trossulus TaxID=6551 RepID=UPI0030051CB2